MGSNVEILPPPKAESLVLSVAHTWNEDGTEEKPGGSG